MTEPPPAPPADDLHLPLELGPHHVSGIWRALLPADAGWMHLPKERFADCGNCPPVIREEYHPVSRCCTYTPHVPNVLLGLALENPEIAPRIRGAIAGRHALPSGTWASPARFARSTASDAAGKFGQDPTRTCSFLQTETGACGIHAYRNAVCSTFFCVNDHGAVGEELWGSMSAMLGTTETAAAQWAMGEAGLPWSLQVERMGALASDVPALSAPDESWSEAAYATIWGEWRGREEAFFARCIAALRAHREGLFERLVKCSVSDAVAFETAVRDSLPEASRAEYPDIAAEGLEHFPLDDAWYQLQLKIRELWELPFGQVLVWAEGIQLSPPTGRLPLLIGGRHQVTGGKRKFWLSDAEVALLRRFAPGCAIDSDLLDSPEAEALDDPRAFLSECLRRELLVAVA